MSFGWWRVRVFLSVFCCNWWRDWFVETREASCSDHTSVTSWALWRDVCLLLLSRNMLTQSLMCIAVPLPPLSSSLSMTISRNAINLCLPLSLLLLSSCIYEQNALSSLFHSHHMVPWWLLSPCGPASVYVTPCHIWCRNRKISLFSYQLFLHSPSQEWGSTHPFLSLTWLTT